MRYLLLMGFLWTIGVAHAQKSKYYGWWEHKGTIYGQDSLTRETLRELGDAQHMKAEQLKPYSESELQLYEDSFKLNYGISYLTGDGDNRGYKWFTTYSGVWKIDNNKSYLVEGRYFTIRENTYTVVDEQWKDSIVNKTLHFTSHTADLILLRFNDGRKATGVFQTQASYPYTWLYLEFGFGNIYTKFY